MNKTKNNSLIKILPGVIVSLVFLYVVFSLADISEVVDSIKKANLVYFPFALVIFTLQLIVRGVAWRSLLQKKVSLQKAFLTINEGYLLNNILPFRLGEVGRAVILRGTAGMSFWQVISTIVVERIFDIGLMAAVLLISLPLVIGGEWALNSALIASGLVALGFISIFLIARYQEGFLKLADTIGTKIPKLYRLIEKRLRSFLEGFQFIKSPASFFFVLFWMIITWTCNVLYHWLILKAFFPEATILWAMLVVGIGSLGVSLPSSPGYLGVFEAAIVGALYLVGVAESPALAFALTVHAVYILTTGIFGVIGLIKDGSSLGDLYQDILQRNKARIKSAD